MHDFRKISLSALVALGLVGCAGAQPSQNLSDARQAYEEARTGPAGQYVPAEVRDAKLALDAAERAHARDPRSDKELHLAYIAHRMALIADAKGQGELARQLAMSAEQKYQQVLLSQRDEAEKLLEDTQGVLDSQKDELEREREARMSAEQDAREALANLNEVATIRTEEERITLTISGEVLFRFDESELLPIGRTRLTEVAEALKQQTPETKIVVEGHADAIGASDYNDALSRDRAEAVREYLVQEGVDPSRIEYVGRGENDPIASNDTPEGRANNRRVEIVLEPMTGQGGTGGGGGGGTSPGSPGGQPPGDMGRDMPETDTPPDMPETDTPPDMPETDTPPDMPETDTPPDIPELDTPPEMPDDEMHEMHEMPESEMPD